MRECERERAGAFTVQGSHETESKKAVVCTRCVDLEMYTVTHHTLRRAALSLWGYGLLSLNFFNVFVRFMVVDREDTRRKTRIILGLFRNVYRLVTSSGSR